MGQCFPFYTYDEDGTNRRENVTDWALGRFRSHYGDAAITKRDVFHYVYAVLHHPVYRERYAGVLKRQLPRMPFAPGFRAFAEAGARLAALHVGYAEADPYPLQEIEGDGPMQWRVEKMRLRDGGTRLVYNDWLTLDGIPRGRAPLPPGQPQRRGVAGGPVPRAHLQALRHHPRPERPRR